MNLGIARVRFSDVPRPGETVDRAGARGSPAGVVRGAPEFIRGLHPAVLNDRGLDAALSGLAARAPLPVRLKVDLAGPVGPPSVEAVAYFIVSEALTNVVKHSQATQAEVAVTGDGDTLRITDNGTGGAAPDGQGGEHGERGTGLRGLQQRAASVDGTLAIHSRVTASGGLWCRYDNSRVPPMSLPLTEDLEIRRIAARICGFITESGRRAARSAPKQNEGPRMYEMQGPRWPVITNSSIAPTSLVRWGNQRSAAQSVLPPAKTPRKIPVNPVFPCSQRVPKVSLILPRVTPVFAGRKISTLPAN